MSGFSSRYMIMSTSPRSPQRLPLYIELLQNLEGNKWDNKSQKEYYQLLSDNPIEGFSIGKSKDPAFSARDKINRAPRALGLVDLKPYIHITDVGKNIQNKYLFKDTLTRQLLKYQLPSPVIPETKDNKGMFNIKPFLEIMRLINAVDNLSISEFYIFGVTLTDYHNFNKVVENIKDYRKKKKSLHISSRKLFKETMYKLIQNLYQDKLNDNDVKIRETKTISNTKFIDTKINNIKDYGNALIRYITGTGLIKIDKRNHLVIPSDLKKDVNFILSTVSREAQTYTLDKYKEILFDTTTPKLLSDDRSSLIKYLTVLDNRLDKLGYSQNLDLINLPILKLKEIRYKKENLLIKLQQEKFTAELKSLHKTDIDNVIDTFQNIKQNKYYDNPLYLEWNTWRAITMIDNGDIHGSFKVNIDGDPINTAPGNTADIIGNYSKFNIVCEVTLSSGNRQYESESEPISRHLGKVRQETNKETFGIFIAKTLSPNIIADLYIKHIAPISYYGGTVEFIPLTIDDFCLFFKNATKNGKRISENDIHNIHKQTIKLAKSAKDEIEWYDNIRKYVLSIN